MLDLSGQVHRALPLEELRDEACQRHNTALSKQHSTGLQPALLLHVRMVAWPPCRELLSLTTTVAPLWPGQRKMPGQLQEVTLVVLHSVCALQADT